MIKMEDNLPNAHPKCLGHGFDESVFSISTLVRKFSKISAKISQIFGHGSKSKNVIPQNYAQTFPDHM